MEKLPFLDNNHGFTPLENVNFSSFQSFCFYSLERRFFVLECRKRHFPSLYFLKKKIGKIGIIWTKPWVKPFKKMWIFGLFELLVVVVYKSVFFVLEYRKRHFPGLYCLKKKRLKNGHFWPIPRVNPFGKMSIFWLYELVVFIA